MRKIPEWQNVDIETFRNEIVPANNPALIRSLVKDWPAVRQSRSSAEATCQYLQSLDNGNPVYTIAAPPSAGGRFFYRDDLQGVNFKRGQIPLGQVLAQLIAMANDTQPHSIAVQALSVRDTLPGFDSENEFPLLDATIEPTMWIGNKGSVSPHYDVHRNLACVIAGSRQFTLFPPDQIANLYVGPILDAPGGVPISMVDISEPDLTRFPRFAKALEVAQQAVLEPGDVIYIPSLWWHGVESLESVNVLVNYWWDGISKSAISPNDSLQHAMLTIAGLDAPQREAWRQYFNYYVFKTSGDPAAHLPAGISDLTTSLSPEQDRKIREALSKRLL